MVRRLVPLVVLALVAGGWSSPSAHQTIAGYGLSVFLPAGRHGVATPGQLQVADFGLGARVRGSPERARVGRGHVHLVVWDYGPSVPYLAGNFTPARPPLVLTRRDLSAGPLEGFSARDVYAIRSVVVGGEMLEVLVDLGPKPLAANSFERVNRVLATLRVQPPRVVPPRGGRLAAGGVALRLLPGWSGRIEVPADQYAAQLVLLAHRAGTRVVLLELAGGQGAHAELPIALTARNVFHHRGIAIARRVFTTAGRWFDLSVVLASPAALVQANRLLATLTAVPRAWTFRSCDLSLRLPGTWRAAVNPRSGCYPVITLHAPGLRVSLAELRPNERATGRRRSEAGRRFEVAVAPRSALGTADHILATLRVSRRSR